MMQDINRHFLALPENLEYGGLFEVRPRERDGVTSFAFTVYAQGANDEARRAVYADSLLAFLKGHSLEFAAKSDPLCASLGEPLITVALADPATMPVRTKHHSSGRPDLPIYPYRALGPRSGGRARRAVHPVLRRAPGRAASRRPTRPPGATCRS